MAAVDLATEVVRREGLPNPVCATWTVRVVDGPDQGQTWRITDTAVRRTLIGRGPACDVKLSDACVARRHAWLEHDEEGMRIVAPAGVLLGRARVRVRDAYLAGDEHVTIGSTTLAFETDGVMREVTVSPAAAFGAVMGVSPQMRALWPVLARLAGARDAVLLEGETGTGKELVAMALHRAGPFARGLEADARGGTLFLDEVGELTGALQTKLLRILEDDAGPRVIAATRLDLDREVEAGRFREELFLRLARARLELPPLRKRTGDIPFLALQFFTELGARPDPALLGRLAAYEWPGNVRELRSAVAGAAAAAAAPTSTDFLDGLVTSGQTYPVARDRIVEEFTRRYVDHMLATHGGNVTRAAAAAGIGRRYFQMVRTKV